MDSVGLRGETINYVGRNEVEWRRVQPQMSVAVAATSSS
jgi:hypothetical protein